VAKHIGLVGRPIGHSLSPMIHEFMHAVNYELYDVPTFEKTIFSTDILGLNVTAPYKSKAFKMVDDADEWAQKSGSVNTIVNHTNGLKGYNTDILALREIVRQRCLTDGYQSVGIVGNGATANSIKIALQDLNLLVKTYARHPQKDEFAFAAWDNSVDVLINATPLGMTHISSIFPLDASQLTGVQWIFDTVYAPFHTGLSRLAKKANVPYTNGLSMLLHQALHSARLMTGQALLDVDLKSLYETVVLKTVNLVLIGLPYSGKSTVGQALAKQLGMTFIDTDKEIHTTTGKHPAEWINEYGEARFRDVESTIIQSLKDVTHSVIATGGGALLNETNAVNLHQNGIMIYLTRQDTPSFTDTRPLATTLNEYLTLKKKRDPLYIYWADIELTDAINAPNIMALWKEKWHAYLNHQWT